MAELVAVTGVHRNTVRAHLARLAAAGIVAGEASRPSGRGRPALRYQLRDALLPSGAEQRLLMGSLVRLVARAYEDGAADHARQEGHRLGRQLGAAPGPGGVTMALRQATRILRELAFAPRLSRHGEVSRIVLRSCPFAVSPDDPLGGIICSFHLGLIQGVVEVSGPPGTHEVLLLPHVAPSVCRAEVRFERAS